MDDALLFLEELVLGEMPAHYGDGLPSNYETLEEMHRQVREAQKYGEELRREEEAFREARDLLANIRFILRAGGMTPARRVGKISALLNGTTI